MTDITVVCSGNAVASVSRSATRAGVAAEIVISAADVLSTPQQRGGQLPGYFPAGAAYQRDRVVRATRSSLIAFLDSGLVATEFWAQALIEALEPEGAAAVVGICSTRGVRLLSRSAELKTLTKPVEYPSQLVNCAFSRAAVEEVGGFDFRFFDSYGSDAYASLELLARLTERGKDVVRSEAMLAVGTPRDSEDPRWWALGRLARRRRQSALLLRAITRAPRSRRRDVLAGALTRGTSLSPERFLVDMPASLVAELRGASIRALAPSPYPKTHFMYAVGDTLVLHLYVNPSDGLRRSLGQRELIRLSASVAGIPRLHAKEDGVDSCWVLEDFVQGSVPRSRDIPRWFPRAADWLVGIAGPPGPPLGDTDFWRAHRDGMLGVAPARLKPYVAPAVERSATLPSRHVHGDCQPRNLRLTGTTVGMIDWEGAWLQGLPGLDLLFLALHARGAGNELDVLRRLARRHEEPLPGLRQGLTRLGVSGDVFSITVTAILAAFAFGEQRRLCRPGVQPSGRPYYDLLVDWLEDLASAGRSPG